MIVKFHKHGSGGGSAPINYLLGKDRDREGARVLRGDPDAVREVIDGIQNKQKYTSVVLSFSENDIPADAKNKIMDGFEEMLMAGMDKDRYAILWVEHTDKGRLELNALIARIDLRTGLQIQPYYHKNDLRMVDNWKNIINHDYGLTDPNDLSNKRTLTTPANLTESTIKQHDLLHRGAMLLIADGLVTNRDELIQALNDGGYKVVRKTKQGISVKDPNGGRNIRLKGAIFSELFTDRATVGKEIAGRIEKYRSEMAASISKARIDHENAVRKRANDYSERVKRSEQFAQKRKRITQEANSGNANKDPNISIDEGVDCIGLPSDRLGGGGVFSEKQPEFRTELQSDCSGVLVRQILDGRKRELPMHNPSEKLENDGTRTTIFERIRSAAVEFRKAARGLLRATKKLGKSVEILSAKRTQSTQTYRQHAAEMPELQTLSRSGQSNDRSKRDEPQNSARGRSNVPDFSPRP